MRDKDKASSDSLFTEVRINQECILFMKCKAPVEPVEFCRRICQDVLSPDRSSLKARYLNRLTPVSVISSATETGVEKASRQALADHFKLKPKEMTAAAEPATGDGQSESKEAAEPEVQPAKVSAPMQNSHGPVLTNMVTVRHSPLYSQPQHPQERSSHQEYCQSR